MVTKKARLRNKIKVRQKEIKMRKGSFLTLLIIVLLWASVLFIIYFLDPFLTGAVLLFLFLVFLASFFTFTTLFINTRRGLLTALALTSFLVLRYLGVGNVLNFLLIAALAIAIEFYLSKK